MAWLTPAMRPSPLRLRFTDDRLPAFLGGSLRLPPLLSTDSTKGRRAAAGPSTAAPL
jgi:hypothetical protein